MVRIEVEIAVIYCTTTYFGEPQFFTEYLVRRDATTVGELKAVIEQDHSLHIAAEEQILRNGSMQLLLDNNENLDAVQPEGVDREQYFLFRKIPPQEVEIRVRVNPAQMHLYPELPNDHEMKWFVSTHDSVSAIKTVIDAEIGISPHRQRLLFLGHELMDYLRLDAVITKMDDLVLTVSEIPRDPESTIEIPLKLATGRLVYAAVEVHDTVHTLRGIILRSGFLIRQSRNFSLHHDGNFEELDGDMTFFELGDATIFVTEYLPKNFGGIIIEEEGGPV